MKAKLIAGRSMAEIAALCRREIVNNISDMAAFGPAFLKHQFARITGTREVRCKARGVGFVTIRPGNSDANTFHQVFVDKTYDTRNFGKQDERCQAAYKEILDAGKKPLIIDAGANVGAATLFFAQRYPEATIIAIEPDPEAARLCRTNVEGRENIMVLEAAVGQSNGKVDLMHGRKSWATQTLRSTGGSTDIVTINDVVELAPANSKLFLVKVDIEGFESDLFASNVEWMNETPLVMFEPHDWLFPGKHSSRAFLAAIAKTQHEILIGGETLIFVK
jgi:FkbM family methyltransferase